MKYTKRIITIISSLFILLGGLVISAEAQTGSRRVQRPIIVRHYWVRRPNFSRWGWYDRWYDPYFYDPYLRERRERYYLEKDVREERKDLREDREKYMRDGVITDKEREKLAKQEAKLQKAINKLNKFRRDRDY